MTAPSAPRRRRLPLVLAVLGLSLVGAIATVQSEWFGRRMAGLAEVALERATGERVAIGSLRLSLWERSLTVDGLVLRHRSPKSEDNGRTIVAVEHVKAVVGLRGGRLGLHRLEIERPSAHLHLDEGKLREFQAAPQGPSGKAPAQELPWDELYVRDGAFTVSATYGGEALGELHLEGLDALPGQDTGTMVVDAGLVELRVGDFSQAASAVHLPDLRVSPARIQAPRIALRFPDIRLDGALDMVMDGPIQGLFSVSTRLDAWAPLLPGRLSAAGQVDADIELSGQTRAPVLGGAVLVHDLVLLLAAPPDAPGRPAIRYGLGDLSADWRLLERQLFVEPLRASWAGGEVTVFGAVDLASRGVWASVTGHGLGLAKALTALDVSPAPWVDMNADLEVQAAGTVQPLRMAGSWTLAAEKLLAANGPVPATPPLLSLPLIRARGQLGLEDDHLQLIARPLSTPRSSGQVDATIGFGPQGPLSVDLALNQLDLRDLHPLADMGLGGFASLHGWLGGPFNDLQAQATTDISDLRLWDLPFADHAASDIHWQDMVHLVFPDVRGMRGQTPLKASVGIDFQGDTSLDLQLLVPDGTLPDVLGIFLAVPGLDARMHGTLDLHGPVGALDGESHVELSDIDLFGEHFEHGGARGTMDHGRFTLQEAVVQRQDGAQAIVARGSVGAGWAANIDVRAGGFHLEDMDRLAALGGTLRGELSLDATVGGTLFEPAPSGLLRLHDTRLARKVVPDSALSFVTRDGLLYFGGQLASGGAAPAQDALTGGLAADQQAPAGSLIVAGTQGLWQEQVYQVQARLHAFPVSLLYAEAPDGSPVDAAISADARVSGHFGDLPSPVSISAQVADTRLAWGRHLLQSRRPWAWQQRGVDFRVDDFTLAGGDTDLSFSGERNQRGATRFQGGGAVDLDLLRMVVPGLERADGLGRVQVSAVSQDGVVRPEVEVQADNVTLRGDWFPATFEDVSARVRATPDAAVIEQVTGRLGGGAMAGHGRIELEGFRPRRYDLQGTVRDGQVRYFDFLPPFRGDAQLSFTGPADSPLLAGQLRISDMLFTDRIDWESWMLEVSDEVLSGAVEEASRNWFSMDLGIAADQTMRVRNNVADLQASADLHVTGDTARPGLVGTVRAVPGGRVYLKEREFELLRGEIRFVDPYAYDPELDFALFTDVRTPGQDYRIDAQVGGSWSDWHTTTRSDPNLPQADVNALLVFGMTREELERSGALGRALAVEGSDVLFSSFGIVERAEEGIFHLRGLQPLLSPFKPERLDLVSGTSERGSGTVSSDLRLLYENDLWDGGRIIFEQNVGGGRDTYVGLEQKLARRLYLRGWWSNAQQERTLQIGGAYGIDMSVRWELQ